MDNKDYEQDFFNFEHTTYETQKTENIEEVVDTTIKRYG